METMASSDSIISIGKEAECEDFVINIIPPAEWPECCIYRVPKRLRKVKKESYTPQLVSIGPFHHRGNELKDTNMKMHKLRYLMAFSDRTGKSQEDLRKIIKENEVKIRHCYSEDCRLNSKDFVKMILLDAIFIIELFLRIDENHENDYIVKKPWLEIGIRRDLLLLENQLPFFILEKLYMFAKNDSSSCNHYEEGKQVEEHKKDLMKQDAPFVKLSRNYFGRQYDIKKQSAVGEEVNHFIDLLRYFFCSVPDQLNHGENLRDLNCATKLDEAGLKFKPVKERCLLDITFSGNDCLKHCPCFNLSWLLACLPCLKCFPHLERMQCILEIPPLKIFDNTECLLRNLMALEQCHYPLKAYICNYVLLLDQLIDTEKDVDLLVEKKVIANNIGSNAAVMTLINRLCLDIVVDGSCYSSLCREITSYLDNPWNNTMGTMKSVYFRDFWRGSGTVVGLIVLGFTFWGFLRPYFVKV
ncbi:UPF0481 protein At3g47200-like [Alnus glutinosa]|uniref:UPF0481 protein At3g47200-like n=1 Tax=Alnus glutinosa TaxID=3517 RepID=UPI002D772E22|nr:UPF0481 protein At3g47200-like [Alnus glutinosa]XP_062173292.1 UPF0481 protein At3g47200-like [Alnus glutinosa]XP_062173347.1 UPF0481 protein At3g47200-like [Alnus glutinosa]